MKAAVGIVGYGRFGRLLARHLAGRCTVTVYDRRRSYSTGKGIRRNSLESVVQREIVVLAVPIGELRHLLKSVRNIINPRALVLDVCSVKEEPLRWMRSYLPPTVAIVGTHPLFGPSSAQRSASGKSIVLCRGRVKRPTFDTIAAHLRRAGLIVRTMTPGQHDRWMARTLFVSQLLGHGLRKVISREHLPTAAFSHLLRVMEIAAGDSPQLLADMYRYNRYAKTIPRELASAISSVLHFRRNRQSLRIPSPRIRPAISP